MSVFTKVPQTELKAFIEAYSIGDLLGFQGIGEGVENTNYFVDTEKGRWVLTLFERLNYDDLPFFLDLMEHVAEAGLPGAAPLRTGTGEILRQLCGKPAAMVARLEGQSVLFPTTGQCRATGETLARLHVATQNFRGEARNSRGAEWREQTAKALLPQLDHESRALVESELEAQEALDLSSLPRGVIHADLFRDNVLFVGERLSGLIDFYYACVDALVYDLAIAINDWCFGSVGQPDEERAGAMMNAYQAIRPLELIEQKNWNLTLRAAALRFYLSRLYDKFNPRDGGLVHVKEPEAYGRILRFHRSNPLALNQNRQ